MSDPAYATTAPARSIPSISDPGVFNCTDGERLWGHFSDEAVDGLFYAWRADGTLIGGFSTRADAIEAMTIFGRGTYPTTKTAADAVTQAARETT